MKALLLALLLLPGLARATYYSPWTPTPAVVPTTSIAGSVVCSNGTPQFTQIVPYTAVPQFTQLPYATALPTATPLPTPVPYFTAVPQYTPLNTPTALTWTAVVGAVLVTGIPTPPPYFTAVPQFTFQAIPTALTWTSIPVWFTPQATFTTVPTATPIFTATAVPTATAPPTFVPYLTQIPLATPMPTYTAVVWPTPYSIQAPIGAQANSLSNPAFVTGATAIGNIKNTGAVLMRVSVMAFGGATNTACVHVYNTAASPVTGTVTGLIGQAGASIGAPGLIDCAPQGCTLTTGLSYSVTGNIGPTDTAAATCASSVVFVYK